jgi:uncharacterized protein YjiS (DUF1127 family)
MSSLVKAGPSFLSRPLFDLGRLLRVWQVRQTTRTGLARLDDHLLDDIGLSARSRGAECAKRFWQD